MTNIINSYRYVSGGTAGWLGTWAKRFEITVSNTNIDSDLEHFAVPLFINTTSGTGNRDLSVIFDDLGTNSRKIAITKSDGTTEILGEIEKWDDSGEDAIVWVSKSDLTLTSASATTLYIYFDATEADNANIGTQGNETGVWSSTTEGSWFLSEASGTRTDSTSNNNDLTDTNTVTSATGQIDGAARFTAANEELLEVADNAGLSITGNIGYRAWVKIKSQPATTGLYGIGSKWGASGTRGYWFMYGYTDPNYKLQVAVSDNGTNQEYNAYSDTSPLLATDTWKHVVFTWNTSAETNIYVDGVSLGATITNSITSINDNAQDFYVGSGNLGTPFYWADAEIDQAALFSENLSAAWAKADYNFGIDNILSYGTVETL